MGMKAECAADRIAPQGIFGNPRRILKETIMCKVLARQSPLRFQKVSRSIRIAGHSTTVRLEDAFWDVLDEIARSEGVSTAKLLSELYDEALELHDGMPNFASVLRTLCLLYQEERIASPHVSA